MCVCVQVCELHIIAEEDENNKTKNPTNEPLMNIFTIDNGLLYSFLAQFPPTIGIAS